MQTPEPVPLADQPLPSRITEEHWQYITWGAIGVGAVAIVALVAVVFGLLSGSSEAAAVPPADVDESAAAPITVPVKAIELIDVPVTGPVTIESPAIGRSTRFYQDGAVVTVKTKIDGCDRAEGMLQASGTIRNDSKVGQTFDYVIGVDLRRAGNRSPIAALEASVENLAPGETADWSVEQVSSRIVKLRCVITDLTVTPVDDA